MLRSKYDGIISFVTFLRINCYIFYQINSLIFYLYSELHLSHPVYFAKYFPAQLALTEKIALYA